MRTHDKLRALAGIVGVIVSQAASGYAFDSYGGVQGRWGLPQAEARRWTDASFSWWYDEASEPAAFQGHQGDARSGMSYWSIWSGVSVATAEAASQAAAEVRISWAALGGNTLAETQAHFGATSLDYVTITFDSGRAWDTAGFLDIMQHEFGHALGLVDMYDDSTNSVIDFVDHPAGGDKAAKTKALVADNVMYGYGSSSGVSIRLFDNDDMYGVNWLFGGPINAIATAEWETRLGDDPPDYMQYFKVADHHGIADGTAEGTWNYAVSIGQPAAGKTLIQIPAEGVWAAGIAGADIGGWSTEILDDVVRYTGPAGFKGNLLLSLTSDLRTEDLVEARVNSTIFGEYPGVGSQLWPRIWAPIPEPGNIALLGLGLAGLAVLRRPRQP